MDVAVEKSGWIGTIPVMTTTLIGRDREIGELDRLLTDDECRLVTIIGPGGVGKTRLALQLATLAAERGRESVAFIGLSAIRDPHLVMPEIGQVFGYTRDPHGDYSVFLTDRLASERALLVLDNLEQVISVAPEVDRLLAACPGIRIIATSQVALGIGAERVYRLEPLDTPDDAMLPDMIVESGSVAFFLDRAKAMNPSVDVGRESIRAVAEICRQLDGLPLAIELAAARMNILSPDALLVRLSDRLHVLGGGERQHLPERLHTVRNAVAWSYELLGEPARRLLRSLSVFSNGFSLDAVEFVVDQFGEDHDAYDLLGDLVDYSLVRSVSSLPERPRYDMLATIRDFGREQLQVTGELDEVRLIHARYLTDFAVEAGSHLTSNEQGMWISLLDAEKENIREAVQWSLEHGHEDLVCRIGGAIWRYLSGRNMVTESRAWLARALDVRGAGTALDRTRALIAAGLMAEDQRDLDVSHSLLEQARHLAVAIGAQEEEHRALIGLGTIAHDRGEYDTAIHFHELGTALARDLQYDRGVAVGLANLASVAYFQGDLESAVRYWEEGQEILAGIGDLVGCAVGSSNLGAAYIELEQFELAEKHLQQALRTQREANLTRDLTRTLINLGEVARLLGDYTLSHDSLAEVISLLRDADDEASIGIAMHGLAHLALVQDDEPEAARYLLEGIRILAAYDDPHSMLECAQLTVEFAAKQRNHFVVIELLTAEIALREVIDSPRTPSMERSLAPFMADARNALGPAAIQRGEEAGRQITLETLPRRLTTIVREMLGRQHESPIPAEPVATRVEHPLTTRELEILKLLAQGHSTNEIAEMLFVSPRTVATHITNILGKLEMSSRTAAVAWALRNGLA
ncbi:MAG TPA: LuxR C-terminal-related transcriptional regulator [Thermomicrobiales bacterium]|nr:LuxR C-terminal-related transcriptional regulator [Thermomicrobiales bacterium]